MGFIENLGIGAAGQATSGLVDAGMGLLLEGHNDRRQIKQQQKLTNMQVDAQNKMTEFNQAQALKMWHDTNIGAQKAEIEKAGMNSAMLYGGMGSGQGATTVSPGSATAGHAPTGKPIAADTGMGMQLQLMQAQKENIEADTRNKEADTLNKPLQGKNIEANTGSLTQGIENAKVANELQKLDLKLQGETYEDRVDYILYTAKKAMWEQEMGERQNYIQKATRDDQVDIIKRAATEALLKNALTEAQTKEVGSKIDVNQAQIKTWATQLSQGWENLDKTEKQIRIAAFKAEVEAKQPGLFNVIGGVLSGALDEISDLTTGRDNRYRQEKKVDLKTK
jgi:hypothetical protein